MLDGTVPSPGGWSRFVLTFDDLESDVAKLQDDGVEFENDIVEQGGGASRPYALTLAATW